MMSAISRHISQPLIVIAAVVLANTCTPARQLAVQWQDSAVTAVIPEIQRGAVVWLSE